MLERCVVEDGSPGRRALGGARGVRKGQRGQRGEGRDGLGLLMDPPAGEGWCRGGMTQTQ